MKKKLYVFAIATLLIVISGCVDKVAEPESDSLETNYLKWKSLGINDYSIVQTKLCFCVYGGVKAVVQIRNNQIVSIQDLEGVQVIKEEYWQYYKTIDQLFETAIKAKNDKPYSFDIEFDKVFGFPEYFYVDPNVNIADEEYGFKTTSLKPLK